MVRAFETRRKGMTMQLFDYVDREKLMQQIADGMVKEQVHPSLPLRILNYTPKAQFTPEAWNEVTDKCRGLIFDSQTGEIVARPFSKFWNLRAAQPAICSRKR